MKAKHILILLIVGLASCGRPIAEFTYEFENEYAPAKIKTENQSEKAETYEWDFGDGTQSQEESPEHVYSSSGHYTVTLIAKKGDKTRKTQKDIFVNAPENCLVEIITDYGSMIVQLYDATPRHRDNFISLVEKGYYNDLLFHRVIGGFMIQGGDPDSKGAAPGTALGQGGPGYTIPAEFVDTLIHVKGALAAARTSDSVNPKKESSGSQFYIVHGRTLSPEMLQSIGSRRGHRYSAEHRKIYQEIGGTPHLDGSYTVFGRIIQGLDVIDKIAKVRTTQDRPDKDIKMQMRVIK